MYFCFFTMKSRVSRTPRAPKKGKKRGRRYGQTPQGRGKVRRKLFKRKLRKIRRRRGSVKNDGSSTVMSFGSNRKLKPYHRPLLAGLPYQTNTSTYVLRSNLGTNKNQQNFTVFSSYVFPTTGAVPTVDPGTAQGNFLSKVWFDQTGNATGNRTRPILHLGCDVQLVLKSCSECPIEVNVYHVISRRDTALSILMAWSQGLTDTYKQYIDTYANAVPQVTALGVTPYMSTPFCQHFKILANRRTTLAPGESHRVYLKQKCMKLFDASHFTQSADSNRKGWTYHTIVLIRGLISNDLEGDVGVPGVKVNYEVKQKYRWRLVNELNRDQMYFFDNSTLATAVGAFQDINEETGQIDTNLATA